MEEGGVLRLEQRCYGGLGFRMGISNGEKGVRGGGNHDLGTRLFKMYGVLQKYPHRFELEALLARG